LTLCEKYIKHCSGCGYCSTEKPGLCVIKDDMQEIFPLMVNFPFHIYLSPLSFGGYNSELKKVVDRYSALGLPTYTIRNGELHHPPRYDNPEKFMAIGILDKENKEQKETFKLLSKRSAISCFASKASTVVFEQNEDRTIIKDKIIKGFSEMELML